MSHEITKKHLHINNTKTMRKFSTLMKTLLVAVGLDDVRDYTLKDIDAPTEPGVDQVVNQ